MRQYSTKWLELGEKILKEQNKPMSIDEMWKYAVRQGYDTITEGRTPWKTLGARIYSDMKENKNSVFKKEKTDEGVKFFLKIWEKKDVHIKKIYDFDNKKIENEELTINRMTERNLHPYLTYYMGIKNVHTQTIYHERSSKKRKNIWIHPDMVGVFFPSEVYHKSVIKFEQPKVKILSFEVKMELNYGNLHRNYFQAVSNSKWANEGYLVAETISKDEDFLQELQQLVLEHGIGVIELDIKNPDQTEILFQAQYKTKWSVERVNRLCQENPDFRNFIDHINGINYGERFFKEGFDPILNIEKLATEIKNII